MIKRTVMMTGMVLLLSACGFQLRGTGMDDFALEEINLQARNSHGETVRQLERLLESNGVRVHQGARYTLDLVREQNRQRTASYTSSARSAEYELTSILDYQFRGPQNTVLLEDSIEVQKVYVHDSSNLIGSDQEANQLRSEMRRELLQQLNMRISSITPAQLDQLQQTAEARQRAEAEAIEAQRQQQTLQPQQSPVEQPAQ
ncbi:LPS assembly lipoprotein LptE [Pseudomonas saudiphocaensis]|uniref:LPS-assembly lipoprotein LptE n=1 Tax=Pseudomonas saudiphocaensis TaxID=1499686 RepID=UPI000F77FF83|nr:LPS assembly lipoprotein LptE [Pseudomonas saudiphocaensis]RRV15630.1 hypothetical protein EGJ00_11590 [Pseudomonas saudiphocaensis]